MKKISLLFLCILFLTILNSSSTHVYAKENTQITNISFYHLKNENGTARITVETGFPFSVLSDLEIQFGTYSQIGFIQKYDNLVFSTDNETVLKLVDADLGVFEPLQEGVAKIWVSYPGFEDTVLDVTVTAAGSYDGTGEIRAKVKEIEELDKISIKTSNIIDFYNKIKTLSSGKTFVNKDTYCLEMPNEYRINLLWNKLFQFLKENKAIYFSEEPLLVSEISRVKKDSIKVTLSRKLNNADVVAYAYINDKKCAGNLDMSFRTIFLKGESGAQNPYDATYVTETGFSIKAGSNSYTIKLPKEIKPKNTYSVVMSIDEQYGYTWTFGSYFTAR